MTSTTKLRGKKSPEAAQIKALIESKFGSLSELARQFGVTPNMVSTAISRRSRKGERAIADALEMPLNALWPDRYTVGGKRVLPRYRGKHF